MTMNIVRPFRIGCSTSVRVRRLPSYPLASQPAPDASPQEPSQPNRDPIRTVFHGDGGSWSGADPSRHAVPTRNGQLQEHRHSLLGIAPVLSRCTDASATLDLSRE